MSQASNQSLQFSIDETVWLRNGYEADEILSLALDPDITIEETSQYVAIKGALRLTGEYKPFESDEEIERTDEVAYRVVDEISETVDGTAYMEHQFPVDITIPASRVRSIDDVYVTVDSLDYSQPNRGCIQLQADISISGLVNEDYEELDTREEESYDDENYDPLETVSYEAYREPEEEEEVESPQIGLREREVRTPPPSMSDITFEEMEEDIEEDVIFSPRSDAEVEEAFDEVSEGSSVGIKENTVSSDRSETIVQEGFEDLEPAKTEVIIAAKKEKVAKSMTPPTASKVPFVEIEEEDVVLVEKEPVQEKVSKNRQDENALYLTKMLTQENEQFTRVKICIVQEGDNLETIAERYKVPVTNILRRNQLNSDHVDEGQVLYIPVKG